MVLDFGSDFGDEGIWGGGIFDDYPEDGEFLIFAGHRRVPNTQIFFDGFNGEAINENLWTITETAAGTVTVSSGILTLNTAAAGTAGIKSMEEKRAGVDGNFRFKARFRFSYTVNDEGNRYIGLFNDASNNILIRNESETKFWISINGGAAQVDLGAADEDWHVVEIQILKNAIGGKYWRVWYDGTLYQDTHQLTKSYAAYSFSEYDSSASSIDIDYIELKKG